MIIVMIIVIINVVVMLFAGIGALQSRQALMIDAIDAMTIQAFLRASGFASEYSLQRSSTAIEQQWTFQPFAQHA